MKKIYTFCEKYQIEIIIMLFCLPALTHIRSLSVFRTPYFLIDYSTGFGGRKLLGQICSLWLPEYGIRKRHILSFFYLAHFVSITLFAHFCGICLRKNKGNQNYWFLFAVLFIYLLCPFSFKGITQNIGISIDIFIIVCALIFCYLYVNKRGSVFYYSSTFLLLILSCLTHHIFCCIYFPLYLSLFIYDIYNQGFDKKKFLIYGGMTICLFILFCYIVFFAKMDVDIETLMNKLRQRTTALELSDEAVYYEYYASLSEHLPKYIIPCLKRNLFRFVLQPIVLFPLFFLFNCHFLVSLNSEKTKNNRTLYYLMALSQLLIIPAFVMAIDYGRWYYAYFFCLFMQITTLTSIKDKCIDNTICLIIRILKQPFVSIIFIVGILFIVTMGYANGDVVTAPFVEYLLDCLSIK